MPNILLKTNDETLFEVDISLIRMSPTLVKFQQSKYNTGEHILLEMIDSQPLLLVLKYLDHHKDDHYEEDMARMSSDLDFPLFDFWDEMFIQEMEESQLFELLMAAKFFDIKPLIEVVSRGIAKLVVCKTPEDIRSHWNIRNDFSEAEEERLRALNKWAEVKQSSEPNKVLYREYVVSKHRVIPENNVDGNQMDQN